METKKAYGVVTALGTKLGEKARADEALLGEIRAASDLDAFRAMIRAKAEGLVPPTLVATFLDEVVTADDWVQWRSRLLIQMKLARDGGKPAPGHEAGRGVGKP